ncbi:mercuric reductase [Olivibacter sp. CPCC 100613]|uniref:mercuric reductase n=1 Tax=Olivibacter sp. CPCC 100613 TaxID=3079931 RepID=UPI002FF52887
MKTRQYDAIIIGSGQAGVPLAKKLANNGKKVAIVEKRWIGGTCINDGCTPTKTWIASAKAAYDAQKSIDLGILIKDYKIDMPFIKRRKDRIVENARNGNQKSLEKTKNLTVIFGEATFTDYKTILVTADTGSQQTLKADLFFLNTGTSALIPEIEGLDSISFLTSTSMLELDHIPEHLLIIGGNYIGLEYGQMFRRFGSKVTILEKSPRIVPREDRDVSEEMQNILKAEGIEIVTNAETILFKKQAQKEIATTIQMNGKKRKIISSHVLIAVGRIPQTASLHLDNTGIKLDPHGYIKVNSKLETNVKGIYALGDVKGGPAFTHISYNDYTIVYRNLIENKNYTIRNRPIPYCMFTDPQLGRIGLSEAEAKKQGLNVKIAKLPMTQVARAVETGDTRGFMKAIVDAKTKRILGACILAAQGGEIMSILQMAMEGKITYDRIRYGVFAHPLYAESLNNLFMTLD